MSNNNCLFDSLGGVSLDGQTVQSILDTSAFSILVPHQQFLQDDGDAFHCGKCKMVLPTLGDFMLHKREHMAMDVNVHSTEVIFDENGDMVTLGEQQTWIWPSYTETIIPDLAQMSNVVEIATENIIVEECLESVENIKGDSVNKSLPEVLPSSPGPPVMTAAKPDIVMKPLKLSCLICKKKFTKQFDLEQHNRIHTGEKPFQCAVCGRVFSQKSNVSKHISTHKVWPDGLNKTFPDKPSADGNFFACPYCEKSCKTYYGFRLHLKQHNDRKVYKCIQDNCKSMFNDAEGLLNHVSQQHPLAKYRCHLCSLQSSSLQELAVHQQVHPSPAKKLKKKHQCLQCRAVFTTPETLSHHIATAKHSHECPECKKCLTKESRLRRHIQTHFQKYTYKCTCGKAFKNAQQLNSHKTLHSDVKPFNCGQCQASFNRRDKLSRHSKIHLPHKYIKCAFQYLGCTREFYRQDKYKTHLRTHTKNTVARKRKAKSQISNSKSKTTTRKTTAMVDINKMPTVEFIVVKVPSEQIDDNSSTSVHITCPGT